MFKCAVCLSGFFLWALTLPLEAAEPIRYGVYKLKGSNPDGLKKYDGRVVIQREGTNYRVTWFIGPNRNQAQVGIGILEGQVLSVGYMDASGRDFGVVSLKVVSNKLLKGKWSPLLSKGEFGEEEFTFESDKIPPDFLPKPIDKSSSTGSI